MADEKGGAGEKLAKFDPQAQLILEAYKRRKLILIILATIAALLVGLVVLLIAGLGAIIGPFFGGASKGGSQQAAVAPAGRATAGPGAEASGTGFANVPLFRQGDQRWRNRLYGPCQPPSKSTMKTSACGPTSLAMVLKFYGKDVDPPKIADFALRRGCRECGSGTVHGCMITIPKQEFGLKGSRELGNSRSQVLNALRNGQPVIGVFGPGYFTRGGHYVVLTGIDAQGNIHFNDSASRGVGQTSQGNVFSSSKKFFLIAP